jgi:hypothetical protein
MKVSELLAQAKPQRLPKARNLDRIDWIDGYLLVWFKSSPALWVYGPAIPEVEKDKLLRVPYPDKLFSTNIKAKYRAFKVDRAA